MTNHIKFSSLPSNLFLPNHTQALGKYTVTSLPLVFTEDGGDGGCDDGGDDGDDGDDDDGDDDEEREDLGQEQLQFYNSIKPQASTTSLDKVGLELQGLELGAQICFQRKLGSGGAGSIDDDSGVLMITVNILYNCHFVFKGICDKAKKIL